MRILVIEDHATLGRSIATALREEGYETDLEADGARGLELLLETPYDLAVLDLMLPSMDGFEVLSSARKAGVRAAVLVLTARDTLEDRVKGLDDGADDYLVKPFALAELLARVRALLRRRYKLEEGRVRIAGLDIDVTARRVFAGDDELHLSAREYGILEYLVLNRGRIVGRDELWEHVYDFAAERGSNVLDVHVSKLRRKLGPAGDDVIRTCRGRGYLVDDDPS